MHRLEFRVSIPVKGPAEFDSDIGDGAGDVRGAYLRVGDLGDDGVLQPHAEAEQEEREPDVMRHSRHSQAGQQESLQQDGDGEEAFSVASPLPVDEHRAEDRATEKTGEDEGGIHQDMEAVAVQVRSHRSYRARHVRGEVAQGEEAAHIDHAGGEGQQQRELPVGGVGSFAGCQLTQRHIEAEQMASGKSSCPDVNATPSTGCGRGFH